jgi:putative salt-induced outer membrane protein
MRLYHVVAALALAAVPALPAQQLTFDLGFVDASGNSDVTNFNLGEKMTWKLDGAGRWAFTQGAKMLYGETGGSRSTESYDVNGRLEYALSPRIGTFGFVAFQRDPFAGVASRWSAGPGVAIGLLRSPRDTLGLEVAITSQRERSTAGVSRSFAATRTAALFKHAFATTAFFTQSLEWLANLETSDDYRLNSESAFTAPISKQIALRVSYLIRFDNLPEPGFESTDRILTTGVQIAM